MQTYAVERYQPNALPRELVQAAARARAAAEELTAEGVFVRYVRTLFLPDEEVCFTLYEGPSAEAVGQASTRADLPYERVLRAFEVVRHDEQDGAGALVQGDDPPPRSKEGGR